MVWIKRIFESKVVGLLSCVFLLAACSISYKIQRGIHRLYEDQDDTDFTFPHPLCIRMGAHAVYFQQPVDRRLCRQTKLRQVNRNGDLQLSGEIVEYSQFNKAVSADGFSSQVQVEDDSECPFCE